MRSTTGLTDPLYSAGRLLSVVIEGSDIRKTMARASVAVPFQHSLGQTEEKPRKSQSRCSEL